MDKNIYSVAVWSLVCAISMMVVLIIILQIYRSNPNVNQGIWWNNDKEAIVAFDYGGGKIRKFQGPIIGGENVWNLFQQAIAAGKIEVEITDHFVPEKIDDLKNEQNGRHWNLYVNNVRQKVIPFEIKAKPGDEIVFKFE